MNLDGNLSKEDNLNTDISIPRIADYVHTGAKSNVRCRENSYHLISRGAKVHGLGHHPLPVRQSRIQH
jgi:hypothetical protein